MKEHPSVLTCDHLSKEFYLLDEHLNWRIVFRDKRTPMQAFRALSDVNLTVPKGQFVAILGRNGAGKSTLLRVLGGIYPPTKGKICVLGQISALFELGGFGNPQLTGVAFADRYFDMLGVDKVKRRELLPQVQAFSELGEAFHQPIYTYSAGMAARLFFSTATEIHSSIYLVDELLSVGDEAFQAKCWRRLRERFLKGASGILVTHDWAAALKLCQSAYILEKGRVIAHGNTEQMVQQYLNLPIPKKTYAEIIPKPHTYIFETGKTAKIRFDIYLKKSIPIAVNYCIELFRAGYGWELLIMNADFTPLPCQLGINEVCLPISKLPIMPGHYYLNIFLKSLDPSVNDNKLDARSWTFGNGVPLRVQGSESDVVTKLPWKIAFRSVADA